MATAGIVYGVEGRLSVGVFKDDKPTIRVYKNYDREKNENGTTPADLGDGLGDVVLAIPACYEDVQKEVVQNTFASPTPPNILAVIGVPEAAAFAYRLDEKLRRGGKALIFELDGREARLSILKKTGQGAEFEVCCSVVGHRKGRDFDDRLVTHFMDEYRRRTKMDSLSAAVVAAVRNAAEETKKKLSSTSTANVKISATKGGVDFEIEVTRERFENLCTDLFESIVVWVAEALDGVKVAKGEVDEVVLVGGCTKMPKIRQILRGYFGGGSKTIVNHSIDASEVAAYGAALKAAALNGSLGFRLPLSVGVRTRGSIMAWMMRRRRRVPYEVTGTFGSTKDNQTRLTFAIFEGARLANKEGERTDDVLLEEFAVTIPRARRGKQKVNITLKADKEGVLTVTYAVASTGRKGAFVLDRRIGQMAADKVNEILENAKQNEARDRTHCEKVRARHAFEDYAYVVKHAVADSGWKLPEADRKLCRRTYKNAFKWLRTTKDEDEDEDEDIAATKDEYENELRKMEALCSPFVEKMNAEIVDVKTLVKVIMKNFSGSFCRSLLKKLRRSCTASRIANVIVVAILIALVM